MSTNVKHMFNIPNSTKKEHIYLTCTSHVLIIYVLFIRKQVFYQTIVVHLYMYRKREKRNFVEDNCKKLKNINEKHDFPTQF